MSKDPVVRLMLKLEQSIHHQGWDEPPQLHAVVLRGDRLGLRPVPLPPGHPGVMLRAVAQEMQDPPTEWGQLLTEALASYEGFYGIAFATEAWSNSSAPSERDGRMLADIPGSKEVRLVTVVDLRGRVHVVQRIRGEKPTVEPYDRLSGRVPWALVTMIKAVAPYCPDGAVDRDAVAKMYVMTDDEAEAEIQRRQAAQ